MTTREQIMTALQAKVASAFAWTTGPSRRLKLWSDVPAAQRPACFIFEGGNDTFSWTNLTSPKREIEIRLFIYVNAHDPNAIGATQLNNIVDALDAAFAPDSPVGGAHTLGGLVHSCRIFGNILKEPGDLDGDGLLLVPLKIIMQ